MFAALGIFIILPNQLLRWWAGKPWPVWEALPDMAAYVSAQAKALWAAINIGFVYVADNFAILVMTIIFALFLLSGVVAAVATFSPARFGYRSSSHAAWASFGYAIGAFPAALFVGLCLYFIGFGR
ncbi:MAG: hypothetical protein AB7K67_01135 [Hyphomicrobiaceae bacterium]